MLKLTALTTPASAARRTSSADSADVVASGFSQTTCLPAAELGDEDTRGTVQLLHRDCARAAGLGGGGLGGQHH